MSSFRTSLRLCLMATVFVIVPAALCGDARADIRNNPIKAHLVGPPRAATTGTPFTVELELSAARAAALTEVALNGQGWQIDRFDGTSRADLAAGGSLRWTLTATPQPGFGPLVLTGRIDGRPWKKSFDLSREAFAGREPSDSPEAPPGRVLRATSSTFPQARELPMEALRAAVADPPPMSTSAPSEKGERTPVTITGQILYWRDSAGRDVPANGAKVLVFYRLPGVPFWFNDETVYTEEDGTFASSIPIPADIYVKFEASNRAVVVEDAYWEADWVWTSGVMEVPEGATQFDIGWLAPASHMGAISILTDLTYLHDAFRDAGYDVGSVDVQWPDDDEDTSYYVPYYNEIHLQRDDAWADWVGCHEWGHYWNDMWAHYPEHDYCNGICDDGDDCGHCVWCPESSATSWLEGLANLVSRIGTAVIEDHVDWAVVHVGIQDVPDDYYGSLDPGCPWDPWNTEGVWAAAAFDLWDTGDTGTEFDLPIEDAVGQRLVDRTHIPLEDLLSLLADHCDVEGHEPYRPAGFFRCVIAYCDTYGSPATMRRWVWQTAGNCGVELDDTPPFGVTGLTCAVPVNVPTQVSTVTFNWSAPSDDISGVCGYSCTMSTWGPSTPDETVDTENTWFNTNQLYAGTWYFSVRAIDRAGHGSATPTVYGPIIIQAPGPAELAPETPSGWTAPLVLRSSTVAAPNPVLQSSVLPAHTTYFNYGGRNSGTGPTGNFFDRIYVDGVTALTSGSHYQGAGNSYSERNLGPYDLSLTGRHTSWVLLDHAQAVPEPNENNNYYAKQFVFVPTDLDPDESITDNAGAPDPVAGQSLVGGTFYPNCDGYRAPIAIYPDVIWAYSLDDEKRHTLRMHPNDVNQTGFAAPWVETSTAPNLPAVLIQNPSETLVTSYCVGVSGQNANSGGYQICRELIHLFAIPDTVHTSLVAGDCLDAYVAYNEMEQDGWFTIKLLNAGVNPIQLHFFVPGFTQGDLADADAAVTAAPGDTVVHHVFLEQGKMSLALVTRDPRVTSGGIYEISAYHRKPDLEAFVPSNWYGNVIPHVGTPYAPNSAVPAPTSLIGGADTTSVYYALRNNSEAAGAPAGLSYRVELDGSQLFGSTFIDPFPPGHELRLRHSALHTVRGGRHTLTHRINPSQSIDEDDYVNNYAGQQWVWSPLSIAATQVSPQPVPPAAHGGWNQVTQGERYDNCDGFTCTSNDMLNFRIFAAYVADNVMDVNIGLYQGVGVLDGFSTTHVVSQTSGAGCDFVLRYLAPHQIGQNYLGVTRGAGLAVGEYSLATKVSLDEWEDPVGNYLRSNVATTEQLDVISLDLPAGRYEFRLDSEDVELGFSLHDLSGQYSGKGTPFDQGIAVQSGGTLADVTFTVDIPSPPPSQFAVAIWRTDGTSYGTRADWQVTISEDLSASVESPVEITASRLVGAAPNPFNPHTVITFESAREGRVDLEIHDVSGRLVRTLVHESQTIGRRMVTWDGRDEDGHPLPTGVYLARLRLAGREVDRMKLTLVK